mmetsp:Transcript_28254/g.59614  ORF Transcript_28254/g.59614 Transcript_28254/m.59614 type:complete len:202 (-) Transcript_28254:470-1075(-)
MLRQSRARHVTYLHDILHDVVGDQFAAEGLLRKQFFHLRVDQVLVIDEAHVQGEAVPKIGPHIDRGAPLGVPECQLGLVRFGLAFFLGVRRAPHQDVGHLKVLEERQFPAGQLGVVFQDRKLKEVVQVLCVLCAVRPRLLLRIRILNFEFGLLDNDLEEHQHVLHDRRVLLNQHQLVPEHALVQPKRLRDAPNFPELAAHH